MLLFLELNFSCCTDFDHCNTAGQLGQTLLQLLFVPIGIGVVDFGFDLVDACCYVCFVACTVNNCCVVLGDDDALCTAQQVEGHVLKLETDFLADDLTTREGSHVLQHCLATIAKAWGLNCRRIECATDLVDNECCECFTLNIFGDDHHWATSLHHCFKHWQH